MCQSEDSQFQVGKAFTDKLPRWEGGSVNTPFAGPAFEPHTHIKHQAWWLVLIISVLRR